jgi:hypothetical protein
MPLSDLVDLTLTIQTGASGQPNQNDIVLISDDTPTGLSDRYAIYGIGQLADVKTTWGDGTDTAEAFERMTQQLSKVKRVFIAKRDAAVAIQNTLTFSSPVLSGQTISGSVNGTSISVPFNTSHAATLGDLETAIEAVEGVASASVAGSVVTIVATAEWELSVGSFSVTGSGTLPTVTKAISVAGRTVADDISDLLAETTDPYCFVLLSNDKGAILSAAAAIEALDPGKLLFALTADADAITSATDDVISQLQDLAYYRTAVFYTDDTATQYHAGLASQGFSKKPGKFGFGNKRITGATPDSLTETAKTNLKAKNGNYHAFFTGTLAGTQNGVCVSGLGIHVIRGADYYVATMGNKIATTLLANDKILINRDGLTLILSDIQATNQQMLSDEVADPDFTPIATMPDPDDIPDADKNAFLASGFTAGIQIGKQMIRAAVAVNVAA